MAWLPLSQVEYGMTPKSAGTSVDYGLMGSDGAIVLRILRQPSKT